MNKYLQSVIVLLLISAVLLAACTPAKTSDTSVLKTQPFPPSGQLGTSPQIYNLEVGWYKGEEISYYNFGTNTPLNPQDSERVLAAPGWLFVTSVNPDGTPNKLEGQFTIFDVMVGDAGYSDLWQIYFVMPPADYVPNSVHSLSELEASGLSIEKSSMLVNCPYVPAGSTLEGSDLLPVPGWVGTEQVAYFDFGITSARPGRLYVVITGFDTQNQPILIPGQHFIFDATRGTSGYSDFWKVYWVLVDEQYQPNSFRSEADIPQDLVSVSTIIVNYPHQLSND